VSGSIESDPIDRSPYSGKNRADKGRGQEPDANNYGEMVLSIFKGSKL
jgi:hypothetical protein